MSLTFERLKKQDLLLSAVLYEKIPKEELIQHLSQVRGEQFDLIDSWAYEALEAEVKSMVEKKHEEFKRTRTMSMEEEILIKPNVIINDEKNYRETIQCKQLAPNRIVLYYVENPQIIIQPRIPEYKIIEGNTFTPNYVNYCVVVGQFGSNVWRRVEHFYWLQEALQQQYPDSLIPPLPAKTLFRKFTPEHISKRCKMLEQFLSAILNNHLLRQSDFIEGFLFLDDDIKFKQLQASSTVLKQPTKYSDYANQEGQVILEFNPMMDKYFMDINNYMLNTNDIYKELTDNSRFMVNSMKDFIVKVKNLAGSIGSLKEATKAFNLKNIVGSLPLLEFVYTLLEEYFVDWSTNLNKLVNTLNENLYEFFRFQRDMQNQCVELISNRNRAQCKYLKEFQDLMKKKHKYFTTEPIEKWEMITEIDKIKIKQSQILSYHFMLPKETQEVEELKMRFAYINRQAYQQITQYFDNKGISYTTRMCNMSIRKKENAAQHTQYVEKIASQFMQIVAMRNGEIPNLKQEWIDQYLNPLRISCIIR
ncbi:unnamed protein product [Paramecium pentaurelia]|uniref:PX domain-containing protein n=1 Tax=Paramecium pentaurelia TaxID=43138 RepID=A0A8S1WFM5_9CILI|nr:unnamed protein product [Paramecium pentaurelia]